MVKHCPSVDDLIYKSKKITLKGHHNKFVSASEDGWKRQGNSCADCNIRVDVISGDTIALKNEVMSWKIPVRSVTILICLYLI